MSKERELLGVALDFLDPRRWLYPADQRILNILSRDIEELLAQPEPLTPRQGLEEYKRGYARAELDLKREPLGEEESYHEAKRLYEAEDGLWYGDGFVDGLKFAEKMHGIGVDYE